MQSRESWFQDDGSVSPKRNMDSDDSCTFAKVFVGQADSCEASADEDESQTFTDDFDEGTRRLQFKSRRWDYFPQDDTESDDFELLDIGEEKHSSFRYQS